MDVTTLYGAQNTSGVVEHLVKAKVDGAAMIKKAGLLLGGSALLALLLWLSLTQLPFLTSLLPFAVIGVGYLVWYAWRFTGLEYEYALYGGEMTVDVIYGQAQRKTKCTLDLKAVEAVGPYAPARERLSRTPGIGRTLTVAADPQDPQTHYLIYPDARYGRTVLVFDGPQRVLEAIRRANPRAFLQ